MLFQFKVTILLFIALQHAIYYRQTRHRTRFILPTPPDGIIFTEVNRFDSSLLDGIKVAFNYCFYKFGLEISLIWMVIVSCVRMDALAVALLCAVLVIILSTRASVRLLWPLLVIYLLIELPLHYAMELSIPYSLCIRKFLEFWANELLEVTLN